MKTICENVTKENISESICKTGVLKDEYNGEYNLDLISMLLCLWKVVVRIDIKKTVRL